jgi:hypothetical protein
MSQNNGLEFNKNGFVIFVFVSSAALILSLPGYFIEKILVVYSQSFSGLNFAAAGDWGCNSNTRSTVNNIINKNPELVLALGDFSYMPTADCWLDIVDPIDQKMKIAIGNHDDISSSLLRQYMNHFGLTKDYYSFNYQNIHFIVLSTELKYAVGSEQYIFVNNDLEKASSDKNIDWIVAYFHRPVYTSPSEHGEEDEFRDVYHPLFDKYRVDLVLHAHNHNYQRSYPMKYNGDTPSAPTKTDNNTSNYLDPEGQIFATVGTAGASLDSLGGKSSYTAYQQSSHFGFLNVEIVSGGTKLVAKFYSNDGTIKDRFTITKSTY